MLGKIVLLFVSLFIVCKDADAQRVKRKGTTPLMKKSKKPIPEAAFKPEQFLGKWVEVSRADISNNASVEIKDTFYLYFLENNKVETREGNRPNVNGSYEITTDNMLAAAADLFTIKSLADNEMVLDNVDEFIHTFKKTESFWFENVGKDSMQLETYDKAIEVSLPDVLGDWVVYRRHAKPGAVKPPTNLIRFLKINQKTSENSATGTVTYYVDDKTEELPCTVNMHHTGMQVVAGDKYWYLPIYKADGKELIFGNVELMLYYCKPIK